jgi:hypothetical protein
MYGRSPYNQVGPSFSWGSPASVPLPETMNSIAAQQQQQQPMGWNTGYAVDPNAQFMAASPAPQFNGTAVTSSPAMMQAPAMTQAPAMMQQVPTMVQQVPAMADGGSAPTWGAQPMMVPTAAGQATIVNYAPLPGAQPAVVGAGAFVPQPVMGTPGFGYPAGSPAPAPVAAPSISGAPAIPAF